MISRHTMATEHFEVSPVIQKLGCLNCPHLNLRSVYEALTKTLGWNYNHRKLQVIWQDGCMVRIEGHKVRRVRGHASNTHAQSSPPALTTNIQMGTYFTFYVERMNDVEKCSLVLNGLESIHSNKDSEAKNKINLSRISTTSIHLMEEHKTGNCLQNEFKSSLIRKQKKSRSINSTKRKKLASTRRKTFDNKLLIHQNVPNTEGTLLSTGQNRQEMDLSVTEEFTDILLDSSDEENEWEDDCEEDIHKVVRKTVTADITNLLDIQNAKQFQSSYKSNLPEDRREKHTRTKNSEAHIIEDASSNKENIMNEQKVYVRAPSERDAEVSTGQFIVLQLSPASRQQAWQFQSAHLKVWYKGKKCSLSQQNSFKCRKPPQRTRQTYYTPVKPQSALTTLQTAR